jgi:hypothetical protein
MPMQQTVFASPIFHALAITRSTMSLRTETKIAYFRRKDTHLTWHFVRQPNGLLVRFSSVVADFTHSDLTETLALHLCTQQYQLSVQDAFHIVWQGMDAPDQQWNESLMAIQVAHGKAAAQARLEQMSYPIVPDRLTMKEPSA